MSNYFTELARVDVSEHIEKKGKFSYLSWTFAVNELLKRHPDATWETKRFDEKPFMNTELGYFVEVGVTVEGIERSQIHPVLNNRNQPVEKPSTFEINTSIQRALVKAIGLHGLGLYIYAGEDVPTEKEPVKKASASQQSEIEKLSKEYVKIRGTGSVSALLTHFNVSDLKNIESPFADKTIKTIKAMIEKATTQAEQEKSESDVPEEDIQEASPIKK